MHALIAEHRVAVIRTADSDRVVGTPTRLWARLSDAWLQRMDVRVARDVRLLDHPGLLADFERAAGG